MKVIIFGGGGFLGNRLACELLKNGGLDQDISSIILFDKHFPSRLPNDSRLECVTGDFSNSEMVGRLLERSPDVIYHLAAVVSGEAEKNLELGMEVNLHATLKLLESLREMNLTPKFIFASSCAVFGGDVSKPISDTTAPIPRSSYGTQKAVVELLINDYSRRGFIDGRSLRLPTIAIRPGKPNAATSSFVSGIIREPLNGEQAICPVPAETEVWIQSPKSVIRNFIHAAMLKGERLKMDRIVTLPGLTVSVGEMVSGMEKIGGRKAVDLIKWEPDEFLQSIVLTWPPHYAIEKAQSLGFIRDNSVQDVIEAFIEEENPLGIND